MLTPAFTVLPAKMESTTWAVNDADPAYFSAIQARTDIPTTLASGDSWTTKAPMPTARARMGATVVNNKIYIIGGENGSQPLGINEVYDPVTDTWSRKADMPTPRYHLSVTAANNKIYTIGGCRQRGCSSWDLYGDNEVYDPVTDTWSILTPMPTHRYDMSAVTVYDKIYVIGGRKWVGVHAYICDENEVYDPAIDSWTTVAPLPFPTTGHGATVVEGKIYVVGGYQGIYENPNKTQVYDPATDTWQLKAELPTGRDYHAVAATTGSNAPVRIHAIGGRDPFLSPPENVLGVNEVYDPQKDTWSAMTTMPTYRYLMAVGAVEDKLYVIGGTYPILEYPYGRFCSTNEEYTPFGWVPEFQPIPTLVSVNYPTSIELREWANITITARNDGGTAEWQTIHIGFPDNPPLVNIEILPHDMNGGAEPYPNGTLLPANYGEYNITSTYVMVEGVHGPWYNGEMHTMTVRVKPENTGTFRLYVKTVNRAFGVTYYNTTDTKDQQDEYVYVFEINVQPAHMDLIEQYFPYLIFDEQEQFYPCNFTYDDTDINDNPDDYNTSWPLACYVHTTECSWDDEDYFVVEYWFYYARDDGVIPFEVGDKKIGFLDHDHDWESVYVFLEKTETSYIPTWVMYFHHANFKYPSLTPNEDCYSLNEWGKGFETKDNTHPIVHVSRDKHGSLENTSEGWGWFTLYFWGWDITLIEQCDGGRKLSYQNFEIIYVEDVNPSWPIKFGDINAPWNKDRWYNPENLLDFPYEKKGFSMIKMSEFQSKLYMHVYDSQSRHIGIDYETNETEFGIPGAYYVDFGNTTFITLPFNITDFKVAVDAQYAHDPVETYELVISTVKDGEPVEKITIEDAIEQGESQDFNVKLDPSGKMEPIIRTFYPEWDGKIYPVTIESNSTVSNFNFSQPEMQISFNVSNLPGTTGFCNITIPKELLRENATHLWQVKLNGSNMSFTSTDNGTHSFIYFNVIDSGTYAVEIIGAEVITEFPLFMVLPLLVILSLLAVALGKRLEVKRSENKPNL